MFIKTKRYKEGFIVNVGIILSGGTGSRFGSELPKQYSILAERPVIEYSIDAFKQSPEIEEIIVICSPEYMDGLSRYEVCLIEGGNTRNQSLYNGLKYIDERFGNCQNVIIQEAARPFITADIVTDYIYMLSQYDGVITAQKITDSIGSLNQWRVNREDYYLIQAPEAFRFRVLWDNFLPYSPITATVQQLPEHSKIYLNFEFRSNLKITYKEDLRLAEIIMKEIFTND
jgi:2-C-methyl-D-erythritol 4-phosphate cytidylyltransferase